ncbi:uncharacterized protein LOC135380306 [Ornithodoros turicata]|uniref:uncharacterized protein LOC135380306 n=1 Tax=Ornithodoros turicata TaxID=34597 RepID=UPI00313A43E8
MASPPNQPERETGTSCKILQELLLAEELGDRRPSQLLQRMQNLLGDRAQTFDPQLMKQLFLQRVPANVQMILATASALPLQELAVRADRIMEVAAPSLCAFSPPTLPTILPISRPHESTSNSDTLSRLQADVADVTEMVAALRTSRQFRPRFRRPRRQSRSPSYARGRNRSPSTGPAPDDSGPCWYHYRFGARARRCESRCSWTGNIPGDR